jgi:hypothetical protein
MWKQEYPGLGSMVHAFPKIRFDKNISFKRVLAEPQYMMWMSDGDLGMLLGLRAGMGEGESAINRSGIDTCINGCAFHKLGALRKLCNASIKSACHQYKTVKGVGYTKGASLILEGNPNYDTLFGGLVDEAINTDDEQIGLVAWNLFLRKARLLGMDSFAAHMTRYHHPQTGRQGVWGRWNMLQEQAGEPEDFSRSVAYGNASTSNGCEGLINKCLKLETKTSLAYGTLIARAQNACSNLGKNLTEVGFSVISDQQGECLAKKHNKLSGRQGTEKTGT